MRKKKLKVVLLIFCLLISQVFSGCTSVEDFKVKFGYKNLDFEYIQQNKVDKIIIQSTRDTGFKFIVTDKRTITDLYEILSTAKAVSEISTLEPDYTFEMYEGANTVHKFNYITGLEKRSVGNLYSDSKIYIVSKRIDNDIIRNLWNLRKPKEFEKVYYTSLLMVLEKFSTNINKGNRIGIDLSQDIDVLKYIFSTDLENFKKDLNSVMSNAELINKNKEDYDITITIKTQGYKIDKYRSMITVYNIKDKSEQKYYSGSRYENGEWTIRIGTEPFEAK